ncbi:MAG: universal stress protein [Acidobacteriia bacterium]|nr:universal stress protein [Terriglobia bacterium]
MATLKMQTRIAVKNIVFATDLSPASFAALPFAAELARYFGAKVFGFHVAAPVVYPLPEMGGMPTPEEETQGAGQALRERLKEQLAGVPFEVVIGHGDIWAGLNRLIEERKIDLVVIGTHGRTGLGKALLGSVAEKIFRQAHCPVLSVGPHVSWKAQGGGETKEILYTTDFSAAAKAAAPYALSLAQESQARLTLLHVIEKPGAGDLSNPGQFIGSAMELLRETVPAEAGLWCEPHCEVEIGSPGDVILEMARRREADLIVMGVRKPEAPMGLITHFGQATAYRVVCEARCPVLTVRA